MICGIDSRIMALDDKVRLAYHVLHAVVTASTLGVCYSMVEQGHVVDAVCVALMGIGFIWVSAGNHLREPPEP